LSRVTPENVLNEHPAFGRGALPHQRE